jgi:hypothetical protein
LEEKLGTATDYVPKAAAPVDRLVEVARRFKLPMAVEWVERTEPSGPEKSLPARRRSLRELVEEIVSVSPEHKVEVEGGILHVYSSVAAPHPFNFLNINLDSYDVHEGDLFEADDQLRWAVRFALYPEKYRDGYGGGYGHGSPEVFEFPKFTISATDVTIRSVLNRIIEAQGNSMWVVTLKGAELDGRRPSWKGKDPDAGDEPLTTRWRFLPLAEIAELAPEQLAVDVNVDALFNKRMTTIPVLMEHRLYVNGGGGTGGTYYEDGSTFSYGARIEKMEQDVVTLSVTLKVKRAGEAEFKFDGKLRVTRGRVTELRPEPGIKIRAYLEPRHEGTKP